MHPLLVASFITLTTLLVDLRGKCKQPINRYIALFFLIAGIGYFFQAMKAEASEIEPYRRYLRSKGEIGEPTLRAISVAIALGGQYAMLVMDEWNKFKSLLLQSKSHFEMEEHYRLIGQYHYDLYFIEKAEAEKKKKK